MASGSIFQGKGITVFLTNEGTSPIPEECYITTHNGNITITIEQMHDLYTLLGQAIQAENRIRKANPNASR